MSVPNREKFYLEEYEPPKPSAKDKLMLAPLPEMVPTSKLKKVSLLEKVVFISFIVTLLCLSVATIKLTTAINREEEAITTMQQDTVQAKKDINRLEQERNELLRQDRVKGIANDAGIKLHEDNIRTIR
ncbi:cell division protein FtsL [Vagococcus penaei]|uniref:Cell division protein FtsL n=1 Tax=Vagococcus penaei TaxID=633807 RepID=A0A1Q2D7V4_9ENTE|nr:cell division protein FtsL [Vagococcus penaei]AQP54417.1 cell division protein FtsL [Vagococcus penaei]RSU06334.1 cell division protein FtsL [Vagococcus penaei]